MEFQCCDLRFKFSCSGVILLSTLILTSAPAQALTLYDNRTNFLNDTSAIETSLEIVGASVNSFTLDNLTFTITGPSRRTLNLGGFDWTTRLPGIDLAVNGLESFDIDIDNPINSFGFDFVEPQFDPNVNSPFIDSTFEVTLLNSGTIIDSFEFTRPNDLASFVGFRSNLLFDKVELRETIGTADNEFFGSFYTGIATSSESVPEPSLMFGYGILGVGILLMKKPL